MYGPSSSSRPRTTCTTKALQRIASDPPSLPLFKRGRHSPLTTYSWTHVSPGLPTSFDPAPYEGAAKTWIKDGIAWKRDHLSWYHVAWLEESILSSKL
ncbi:hypothetical protein Naga_100238g3 [Nannochloropsis gaditana]|uniref:Uncharacterized protein n=1 Tax=Nannochloropsis gaditana TaxID=72520 RepID=W7T8U2_9STRA|nr:hypothetical protein Naga_100238g3 [Nannochloropsis gaditana]